MSAICIIPARGGSTRIPRKNIRHFAGTGRPMLTIAIVLARSTKLFERIFVSTEDDEIGAVALGAGASVLPRHREFAADEVGTQAVIQHALSALNLKGIHYVCGLYPCTPLLTVNDLIGGFERLLLTAPRWSKDFVFGAIRSHLKPSQFLVGMTGSHGLARFNVTGRAGDSLWFDAGQFYWGTTDAFVRGLDLWENALPYQLPVHRAIDINTFEDLEHAELVWHGMQNRGNHEQS